MTTRYRFPSELDAELTDLGADDYLVAQKAGENRLSKLKPAAIAAGDIGALSASGGTISGNLVIQGTTKLGNTLSRTNGCTLYAPGQTASPVYAFEGDPNTGVGNHLADTLSFITNGEVRCYVGGLGNFRPYVSDTYNCGDEYSRWAAIYAQNGTIQTSDARAKTDIADSDLGLDFIATLRPVRFKMRETGVVDANGVPGTRAGVRPHYGLIAQEVRQALDALGHDDFGGYCHNPEADTFALRYDEFIAPLIKAVQELAARVEALEAAVGTS